MQKLRERKLGIPAASVATGAVAATTDGSSARGRGGGGSGVAGEGKEDLVLQDTFAQETAVTIEDPNMCVVVSLFGYSCQCDGSPCYCN